VDRRLRAILVVRGGLALFLVVLGVVLLATGSTLFGVFAVGAGTVNAGLVVVLARRARPRA
jgi:hypothetical protein